MKLYMRYPKGYQKALTFSYDDGVDQDIRLIALLDKYGMKGTFNLNGGLFAPEDTVYPKEQIYSRRMSKSQCKAIYQNHEVAVHGFSHPYLDKLPLPECLHEILEDRKILESLFQAIIPGMAYPYGTTSSDVIAALKACGIVYARTVISTEGFSLPTNWLHWNPTCHHGNPNLMELAERFVERNCTLDNPCELFYLWGHSYELDVNDSWKTLETFLSYMANRNIWYATNLEIYDYVQKYQQLRFSEQSHLCYNPTDTELFFVADGTLYCVKPGQTLQLPQSI